MIGDVTGAQILRRKQLVVVVSSLDTVMWSYQMSPWSFTFRDLFVVLLYSTTHNPYS